MSFPADRCSMWLQRRGHASRAVVQNAEAAGAESALALEDLFTPGQLIPCVVLPHEEGEDEDRPRAQAPHKRFALSCRLSLVQGQGLTFEALQAGMVSTRCCWGRYTRALSGVLRGELPGPCN